MKMKKAGNLYLKHIKKNLSYNTYRTYKSRLKHYIERFGDQELESLNKFKIEKFIGKINKDKAPDTVRLNIRIIEQLQKFIIEKDISKKEFIPKLIKPRGRIRERIPTRKEQAKIIKNADKSFRDIFRALRKCGARPHELCQAKVKDYDREIGIIVLTQHKTGVKTGRTRRIGVGKILKRIILRNIKDRTDGLIFLDKNNRPWTPNKLSKIYKKLVRRFSLSDDLCLYMTRHEYGTNVCKTLGVMAAAHALGHRNIQTTQRYIHLNDRDLVNNQDKIR